MKNGMDKKQVVYLVFLVVWLVQMACSAGVSPDDDRLQAPLTNMGMAFEDFIKQLKGVPWGGIMAPWITEPPDKLFLADDMINIKGWAPYHKNAQLVLYEVRVTPDLTQVVEFIQQLAVVSVDQNTNEWQIDLDLPVERQFLAARLELENGKTSPFSNIVYVSRGEPAELKITTPPQNEVIKDGSFTLQGMGEPLVGITLTINGAKTPFSTTIQPDGSWQIAEIPLFVQGFDQNNRTNDINNNVFSVYSAATDQTADVVVRKIEPIQLLWPFGTGDTGKGENYSPRIDYAQVSAFYNNDWHYYQRGNKHPAMDISSGTAGRPIHSVSDGVVVAIGTKSYGNYMIVDSGGWGVLYLHIVESPKASIVQINQRVKAGQVIATEGGTFGYPVHLHLGVCVWEPFADRSNINSLLSGQCININPPIEYQAHFNNMGIELYHLWGGSEFCHPDGCWKDVDWRLVDLKQSKPSETYNRGCIIDSRWTGGVSNSSYATRRLFCSTFPDQCRCD